MSGRTLFTFLVLTLLVASAVARSHAQTGLRTISLGGGAGAPSSTSGARVSAGQSAPGRSSSGSSGVELGFWNLLASQILVSAPTPTPPAFDGLDGSYPNPFNPRTTIRFSLAGEKRVRLELFDLTGRRVARLMDDTLPAGSHSLVYTPRELSSGVYMLRMQADDFSESPRLVLLK